MKALTDQQGRGSGEAGMTLIEVMVASVIFLVGILALLSLQVNAMKANADAFKMTEGATILSDRIEQLMSEVWTEKSMGAALKEEPQTPVTEDDHTVSWVVTDSADGRSKNIAVTVTWTSGGESHSVSQVMVRSIN